MSKIGPDASAPLTLSALLRDAAGGLQRVQPPPALRERVLASWHAGRRHGPTRTRRWRFALAWSGTLACALALVLSLLLLTLSPEARDEPDPTHAGSGFVPIVGAPGWQQVMRDDATTAWLVRTELPRERLALLGLPFDPARAGELVHAELLMHASGDVLAVRVVQP